MPKLIYNFNSKEVKKIKNSKYVLGGKGSNLSEMGRMGLPVPPGFTISTSVCDLFYKNKKQLKNDIINQIKSELKIIEKSVKKIWRFAKSTFTIREIRCKSFNAWHDGYNFKSWT